MRNVPDDAVEAAQEAVKDAMVRYGPDGHTDGYKEIVHAALKAAAPIIAAQAWDEGMWAMYNTTSSEWPPIPEENPYRK